MTRHVEPLDPRRHLDAGSLAGIGVVTEYLDAGPARFRRIVGDTTALAAAKSPTFAQIVEWRDGRVRLRTDGRNLDAAALLPAAERYDPAFALLNARERDLVRETYGDTTVTYRYVNDDLGVLETRIDGFDTVSYSDIRLDRAGTAGRIDVYNPDAPQVYVKTRFVLIGGDVDESRHILTDNPLGERLVLDEGRLHYAGTRQADALWMRPRGASDRRSAGTSGAGIDTLVLSDGAVPDAGIRVDALAVRALDIAGRGGDDEFDLEAPGVPADISLGPGDDVVDFRAGRGHPGARIDAGPGDDVVSGRGELNGGDGDDVLTGTGTLLGGAGDDQLSGSGTLDGGPGRDRIAGSGTLIGGPGDDHLAVASSGVSVGGVLYGGPGDDTLLGSTQPDTLEGGPGDDRLDGGGHDDWLFGQAGRDTLRGGRGNDRLDGGRGLDLFLRRRGSQPERLPQPRPAGRRPGGRRRGRVLRQPAAVRRHRAGRAALAGPACTRPAVRAGCGG